MAVPSLNIDNAQHPASRLSQRAFQVEILRFEMDLINEKAMKFAL